MTTRRHLTRSGAALVAAGALLLASCGSDEDPTPPRERGRDRTTSTATAADQAGTTDPANPGRTTGSTAPAADLEAILVQAVASERSSLALYEAAIAELGAGAPFSNVARAEQQHIDAIERLAAARSITLPADDGAAAPAPSSRAPACQAGVDNELAVVAFYDEVMPTVAGDAEATRVFTNLRDVSEDAHLLAFQRCA